MKDMKDLIEELEIIEEPKSNMRWWSWGITAFILGIILGVAVGVVI